MGMHDKTDYHAVWARKLEALKKAQGFIENTLQPMSNDDLERFDEELTKIFQKMLSGV